MIIKIRKYFLQLYLETMLHNVILEHVCIKQGFFSEIIPTPNKGFIKNTVKICSKNYIKKNKLLPEM